MYKRLSVLLCLLTLLLLGGCTLPGSKNSSLENELQEALTRYLTVHNAARITFDTTSLSSVSTGDALENTLNFIATYEKLEAEGDTTSRSAEEFEIEWLEILAFGSSWAVIEAKNNYLTFSQDLQTGEKSYDGSGTKWRIQRFLLIKENDVWKVDRVLEFVSWSG